MKAIAQLPSAIFIKDLRSVLGTVHVVQRFVKDCPEISPPLVEITRQDFVTKKYFSEA